VALKALTGPSPVKMLTYAAAASGATDKQPSEEGPAEESEGLKSEPGVYEPYGSDADEIVIDLAQSHSPTPATERAVEATAQRSAERTAEPTSATAPDSTPTPAETAHDVSKESNEDGQKTEQDGHTKATEPKSVSDGGMAKLVEMLAQGASDSPDFPPLSAADAGVTPPPVPTKEEQEGAGSVHSSPAASNQPFTANGQFGTAPKPPAGESRRQSVGEKRRCVTFLVLLCARCRDAMSLAGRRLWASASLRASTACTASST
jgi:hypothetical protein